MYSVYIAASYGITFALLGALVWVSLRGLAQARHALSAKDKDNVKK